MGSYLEGKTGVGATWTRGNPYLLPEMSKSSEIGLELHFFKHRLNMDVAYYTNDSFNQILSPRGPQSTGYIFCSINAGNVYNRGLEVSLSATPVETKDFVWETSINAAGNRGTMTGLPAGMEIMYVTDVQYGGARAATVSGGHFMAITGTRWTRIKNIENADGSVAKDYGDMQGTLVLDRNGFPTTDNVYSYEIGNREALFTGGWNNTLSWKGLTFNMLWEFRRGGSVFNGTKYAMTLAGTSQFSADVRNQPLTVVGRQQTGVDDKDNPIYGELETHTWDPNGVYEFGGKKVSGYNIIQNYYTGAYNYEVANWITDVNSLRLRTVSLTYDFPKKWIEGVFKRASVSVTANNLLLFTNYDGDPEVAASGAGSGGSSSVGFDYLGTPATSSVTFGVNLTF